MTPGFKSRTFIVIVVALAAIYAPSAAKNFMKNFQPTAWEVYCKSNNIDPNNPTQEDEDNWEVFQETDAYQELMDQLNK